MGWSRKAREWGRSFCFYLSAHANNPPVNLFRQQRLPVALIELNPVIVTAQGAVAVDALIAMRKG